ncbi:MAG TPA: helix-turn-helix domain-containing protein [Pseudonocardia sp.]|jgi:DNA-binding IclR family transcriptional regulator|nr:helix-turn-helix domain-containing protein [Pseudonocardia sp.]
MDATLPGEGRAVIGASFELLEHLRRLGRARLVELVRASGLPRATVHRMLVQLSAVGAVRRDGDHYRLGATLLALGGSVSPAHRLREAAARPLAELAIFTGGAVSLSERIDRDAVLLDAIPGRRALPGAIRAEPGATLPLGTATARVHGVGNTSTSAAPTLALDDRSVSADLSCVAAAVALPGGHRAAVTLVLVDCRPGRALQHAVQATALRISNALVSTH